MAAFEAAWNQAVNKVCIEHSADMVQFNSEISERSADRLMELVSHRSPKRPNLILILTTNGGDPHAAYRMVRYIKHNYKRLILFILGHCKSAGTLIVFGADEVVMSQWGELGPLDVQLLKDDDLLFRSSGLDVSEAISKVVFDSQNAFQRYFTSTLSLGGGMITTKTASDVATSLAVGLFRPIMEQIDPLKMGETSRSLRIVQEYAARLSGKADRLAAIAQLSSAYPSHGFVIDRDEAISLFGDFEDDEDESGTVRSPKAEESFLESLLHHSAKAPRGHSQSIITYIDSLTEGTLFHEQAEPDIEDHSSQQDGAENSGESYGANSSPQTGGNSQSEGIAGVAERDSGRAVGQNGADDEN